MDAFELNKFAGAFLAAVLLMMLINEAGNMLVHPTVLKKSVLGIETATAAVKNDDAKSTAAPAQSLGTLLVAGDADKGAKVAKKCASCHTFNKGGKNKVGPNLFSIPGRDIAKGAGFSYSGALSSKGGKWSYESLDAFIAAPKKFAKGTKMSFKGISKPGDRANLIAYMRKQAENPPALPAK